MKLAEAKLEIESLEFKLKVLESRLSSDLKEGRHTTHIFKDIESTINLLRDIRISIQWTEQNIFILGLPLGSYYIRIDYLHKLANLFEKVDREQADQLREAAYNDFKFINSVEWKIDLRIPKLEKSTDKEEN